MVEIFAKPVRVAGGRCPAVDPSHLSWRVAASPSYPRRRTALNVDELWGEAQNATNAAHEAQQQLDDAWSNYRSLTRSLTEAGQQAQQAHRLGQQESRHVHDRYHALLPKIEAQMGVLQQAIVDREKAETERRVTWEVASRNRAE